MFSKSFVIFSLICLWYSIMVDADNSVKKVEVPTTSEPRTIRIDYQNDVIMLDGYRFRFISGSLHYFRIPRSQWDATMKKMRAAGLNAIQTYIEWSQHEPKRHAYDFSGDLDIVEFIKLAQKNDLYVLLRPGPYICAERDLGGYPAWLFTLSPRIKLRTSDPDHTKYVEEWLKKLMPMMQPLLYENGGPIIMVQVENEYGSYFACDKDYTLWLRDFYKVYVKDAAILYTTDGASDSYLKCGSIPGVFMTVDFGPGSNVQNSFQTIRKAGQTHGPLVNSEFYAGWLTHWNDQFVNVSTASVLKTLKEILDYNPFTNVNIYMFQGGTNFGFTNGANCDDRSGYLPQQTSYDYDAPITEAGDLTEKYFAIQELLRKYTYVPNITVERYTKKGHYGIVNFEPKISLFDMINISNGLSVSHPYPLTFEELSVYQGFVFYKHNLTGLIADPALLYAPGIRDRAIVFVDEVPVGILSRFRNIYSIPLKARAGQTLGLLVENQGHINFASYMTTDFKGIICQVELNGQNLLNWEMTPIPLDNITEIEKMLPKTNRIKPPALYTSTFQINSTIARDSYLNLEGWGKGVAFLNGFNLGRYWVNIGPQVTLYVPKHIFKLYPEMNKLTIFEQENENEKLIAVFQDYSIINSTVPTLMTYQTTCQTKCKLIRKNLRTDL